MKENKEKERIDRMNHDSNRITVGSKKKKNKKEFVLAIKTFSSF